MAEAVRLRAEGTELKRQAMAESEKAPGLDANRYRMVLGHYPTGVVVISALDDAGEPVGMVVGSFTSASIDPPLVAYLPSKSSSSYRQLRGARHFVVNVLAADQVALCRQFAMKDSNDKWAGVSWRKSARGLPILDGAVAWIECEVSSTLDAGDHDVVLGRVVDLDATSDRLPLVFFQGGYGRFTPRSIVSAVDTDLIPVLQMAERARPMLERLGESVGYECGLQAALGEDLVLVAAYAPLGAARTPHRVGARIPFVPPSGSNLVAWASERAIEAWLGRWPVPMDAETRETVLGGLARVRQRGFSLVLHSPAYTEIDTTLQTLADRDLTPAYRRRLLEQLSSLVGVYEPSSLASATASRIRVLSVPVRGPGGDIAVSLQLRQLPAGQDETAIADLVDRLQASAREIAANCLEAPALAPIAVAR